jgi:thiosulfate dehydrogenase [quinone] large subunit
MADRVAQFVWGLAAALLVAVLVFTVGVDELSHGIGAFLMMLLLLVAAFVLFVVILGRVRGGTEPLHPDRAATIGEPGPAHFLFHDTRSAPLWLVARVYVGFAWLEAAYHKATGTGWLDGGAALKGFWSGAVAVNPKTGTGPITYDWYRHFLQFMLDQQWYTWFAKVIVSGEFLVGLGLVLGVLTGWAAFFGLLMNMSFMLAGSASTNPVLFSLSILLILAWRVAGYFGGDRVVLPALGVPGLGRPAAETWGGAVREVPQPAGE